MMRYARYAAAVLFALLAMAFVALWVRSYHRWDVLICPTPTAVVFTFQSAGGSVLVDSASADSRQGKWLSMRWPPFKTLSYSFLPRDFRLDWNGGLPRAVLPHWFVAASSFALAALFAFKRTWRYSLRTILVATTLLAAALGLAVYAV
jgi:hypothetical protein